MKKLSIMLVGALVMVVHATAQENLKKVEGTGIYTSDNVFVDEKGEYYAKVFYITFKKHVTEDINQAKDIQGSNIKPDLATLKSSFAELEAKHGLQKMERLYPEAVPNDTIRYSKKGKRVVVSDHSKRYKLVFEELKSLEGIKRLLNSKEIKKIGPPKIIHSTSDYPNDPYFDNQWTHKILESEKVFDITHGNEDIIIGISDRWTSSSTHGVHEELEGRIPAAQNNGKYVPGTGGTIFSHGPRIAIIAAGTNDNGKGVASLGGNMQVIPAAQSAGLPYFINLSPSLRPDVINMSWTSDDDPDIKDDVEALLDLGVVLVGASVNDIWWDGCFGGPPCWPGQSTWGEPFIPYPASYNFSNGNRVISTTITQLTDSGWNFNPLVPPIDPFQYEERFGFEDLGTQDEMIFNYGLSNNPIVNPSAAFTDVAAPSRWIFTARGEYASESVNPNEYRAGGGATSEAAPLVTSIVGMMLSVNPELTVSEVYDIITSTTDYDNIVVPPDATTFHHPDGVRKYNKYIGYGRVNAYRAVLAAVPKITEDVTTNDTWSGYVHLENTTRVENNSTLTIEPGTTVLLDEGVNLSIRSGHGGKLIAEGTEENPIRFIRSDPDKAWGTVYLNSSEDNSVKWALFDGGSTNLTIASQNNTIEHSTFRNATFRNIDTWHNNDGSGNSSATLSHVLVEDGATVGMVAQFTDLDISNSTIQNNAQAGIYITSASVYPFHRNEVINNGGSARDGVEVMSSGTFYMQNANLYEGYNEISGNQRHQVSSWGDLIVGTYYPGMGGKNSVHGDHDSESNYLVKNNSSTTVKAYDIWWGQSTTDTTMFYGPVNTSYFILSSDPTDGEDHGSGGQTPAKGLPGNEDEDLPLAEVYDQLESDLEKAETNQQVRDGLHRLYQVVWLAKEESPELGERFRQFAVQASDGTDVLYASSGLNATLRDAGRVLQGKSLMRSGEYEKASRWLAGGHGQELSGHDHRDWLHLEMDLLRYRGEYRQALEVLSDLYSYESSRGTDMDVFRGFYQPIEEDIAMRLGADSGQLAEPQQQAEKIAAEVEVTLQNYPNPFNPATVISYQLPAQSEVRLEVFDMLGRRVAILVDDTQSAGTYSSEFDASNLASGVYLYRLQTGDAVQTRQMVLVK